VRFERLTTAMGVLVLAGPRARDVLAKVTRTDLSNEAFPG
jgi:dimethylglycine dehydrogenase